MITWEISAHVETECEGRNRCFLFLLLCTRVLRMRLWIFGRGWNILAITLGISSRSTGLKISSRVAQTRLKLQPGSPGWNFLHIIANSFLIEFYRKPGMNYQPSQPGWKFIPGRKSACNQPLKHISDKQLLWRIVTIRFATFSPIQRPWRYIQTVFSETKQKYILIYR